MRQNGKVIEISCHIYAQFRIFHQSYLGNQHNLLRRRNWFNPFALTQKQVMIVGLTSIRMICRLFCA